MIPVRVLEECVHGDKHPLLCRLHFHRTTSLCAGGDRRQGLQPFLADIAVRHSCAGNRYFLQTLDLLDALVVFEPNEQGKIVLEVFGADTAVAAEEAADMPVHGVDVLEMQIPILSLDLGLVLSAFPGDVGSQQHVAILIALQVLVGDFVLIGQHQSRFFIYMSPDGFIQHLLVHEANAGNSRKECLVSVFYHAEDAGPVLGGRRPVI